MELTVQDHSNYDSFHWMEEYGDPGFRYHIAMAKIWGLITLSLTEDIVVPFNASAYALGLQSYLDRVTSRLMTTDGHDSNKLPHLVHSDKKQDFEHRLRHLNHTIYGLIKHAARFDQRASSLRRELNRPDLPVWKMPILLLEARKVNQQYKKLDRAFIFEGGLDNRPVFKHVVYARKYPKKGFVNCSG